MVKLTAEQRKVIILSSMGGLLEFYDFTIYGLFAVYFSHQFFPAKSAFISLIASYSVFVIGYVVRPIGGIIFSHIGDEIGRKTVMILTMVLMGIASLGLGLSPTYAQIGIWAPVLMLFFRLMQGLALGGELPSMIVYVAESIPNQRRGLAIGGIFGGTVAGLIPGMLINLVITHYLNMGQLNSFGWRIPFILGGLLCILAYQVRRKLHETLAFQNLKQHDRLPFAELIKHHLSKVIIGIGLIAILATPIILALIFMPSYLVGVVKLDKSQVSLAILIATVVSVCGIYITGVIADRVNLYSLFRNLVILLIIAAILCYYMIANYYNLIIALTLFAFFQGCLVSLPVILLSYLFPVHVRLSGVALAYNISFVLFGGLTPVVVTSLIDKTGLIYIIPVACLTFTIVVTLIALNRCKQYVKF